MNRDEDLYTYFRSALCSPQIRQGQDRTLSSHDYDDSLRIESLNHMDQALMTIRFALSLSPSLFYMITAA